MIYAFNWKMNGFVQDSVSFVRGFSDAFKHVHLGDVKLIFCPPFTCLQSSYNESISCGSRVYIGAQDCHHEEKGARTGLVSAPMLRDVGCSYVIVGHSESCSIRDSARAFVSMQVEVAILNGLCPIVCIGEHERLDSDKTVQFLVDSCVRDIPSGLCNKVIVAYEPVWAIGTGIVPSKDEVLLAVSVIKDTVGSNVPVLYGGSVSKAVLPLLIELKSGVDGFLIGNASLHTDSCIDLCMTIMSK